MLGMIKSIRFWIIDRLWGMKSIKINFDRVENQKVISEIEKSLFQTGELKNDGLSPISALIRRTLAQFLGQKYWIASIWIYITRNIISVFALPFCILLPIIKGTVNLEILGKKERVAEVVSFLEVEFCRSFLEEIFPNGYLIASSHNKKLDLKDIRFIFKVFKNCKRYLLYPELLCRVIIRISQYSSIIRQNRPRIISNFAEGSCWSSILTAYCREFGVKHVNIMHGIRYYSSPMAFAEFDTFYVWGEYYLEQFKMMNVSAKEFIVLGNPIHRKLYRIVSNKSPKQSHRLIIMYEYSLFQDERLFSLLCAVIAQINAEWEIACRLHYQEIKRSFRFVEKLRHKLQREIIIEDPAQVLFENSIKKCDVVVGCYTNALTDAWIAGKKCIYLHIPDGNKIPLQEYHQSKNIKNFCEGDSIQEFLNSPTSEDESELILKNRFSRIFGEIYSFRKESEYTTPD